MADNMEDVSMGEMMDEIKGSMKRIESGEIVKGTVISVSDEEIFVNIGFMSDGIISKEEFTDDLEINLKEVVNPGDELEVYIIEVNDGNGNVSLSKKKAENLKVWEEFEDSLKNGSKIKVTINQIVKGGAVANVKGVRAFIPASQLSASYVEDLNTFLGKELEVKVIEYDQEQGKAVLSRKEIEVAENEIKKEALMNSLVKGESRKGIITRLAKFGAFVDLGGVDGLIHISDLSWKRINDPSEVVSVGDNVDVYVIDFDKARGRISLGLKQVSQNPWNEVETKYKVGQTVEGTIVRLMDFGAFTEIEPGLEGLVHISEISEDRIAKPSDVLKVGDKVKVKISEINANDHRISLSIKDASAESSQGEFKKYNDSGDGLTLGDLLKDKFKDFKFD
jgi:small subunit ribosomal protein S1